MIVTLFWSRFKADMSESDHRAYQEDAAAIAAQAETMPGYISHKTYTAEDGERLTVVQFESEQDQEGWRMHAEHRAAQQRGRDTYYGEYRIMICTREREHTWRDQSRP